MTRLIALYPRAWRDRYEVEFGALMAERPPNPADRIDIIRGAIDARIHPQVGSTRPGDPVPTRLHRLAGLSAVLGGLLWIAASAAFYTTPMDPDLGYKDSDSVVVVAAAAALLSGLAAVAMALALPRGPVVVPVSASAALVGTLGLILPWPILVLGFYTVIIGTILFGLTATPRLGAGGMVLAIAALIALAFNTESELALALVPLGASWVLVGMVVGARGIPVQARAASATADSEPPRPTS